MELMVVIAIIAVLSAIALPGYQRYLDRAALTDMLWIAIPYRLAVELCAMQQGDIDSCHTGQQGVPASHLSRYVSGGSVRQGVISLTILTSADARWPVTGTLDLLLQRALCREASDIHIEPCSPAGYRLRLRVDGLMTAALLLRLAAHGREHGLAYLAGGLALYGGWRLRNEETQAKHANATVPLREGGSANVTEGKRQQGRRSGASMSRPGAKGLPRRA